METKDHKRLFMKHDSHEVWLAKSKKFFSDYSTFFFHLFESEYSKPNIYIRSM